MAYTATGVVAIVKRAVLDAVRADAAVAAIAADRIYDITPASEPVGGVPYVYLGPLGLNRAAQNPCASFHADARFRLFAASGLNHREQAWDLAQAIIAALDGQRLALSDGHKISAIEFANAGDVVDPIEPILVFADFTARLQSP